MNRPNDIVAFMVSNNELIYMLQQWAASVKIQSYPLRLHLFLCFVVYFEKNKQ